MEWSNQDAGVWAKALSDPTVQKGLKFIAKKVRPRRSASPVGVGFDLSPVFIKSAGFYEGAQEVFDLIESLSSGEVKNKPPQELPEPFGHIEITDLNLKK